MGVCTCGMTSCGEDHRCKWHSKSGENEYANCRRCAAVEVADAKRELRAAEARAKKLAA